MEYIPFALVAVLAALILRYLFTDSPRLKQLKALPNGERQLIFKNLQLVISMYSKKPEHDINVYIMELIAGTAFVFLKEGFIAFRIGSECVVSVFSPDLMEKILSSSVSLEKSFEYSFLHKWLGTGLLTSTGSKWRTRRKLLTPCFHFQILEDFLPIFHDQSNIFMRKLINMADQEYINIVPLVILCTLDIVCETVMGIRIGAQEGENSEYVDAIHNLGDFFTQRTARPWLWSDRFFFLSSMGRRNKRDVELVHNFTQKVIKDKKRYRRESSSDSSVGSSDRSKKRQALMDLLLDLHWEKQQLSEEDIREEVDTFMFEGHDTTAVGIIFALYFIGLYKNVQKNVHDELDSIFENDKERQATMEDVRNMKYLECVLKESQRLNPSVPIIGRKLEEEIIYKEFVIPKDITVHCDIYSLHRNPATFPKPEVFDPGRFSLENIQKRHPYSYIPFSAGPRNCIGQKFAMLEEKVVISNILRHFTILSLDPRDKLLQKIEFTLRPANPVRMRFFPR